MIRAGRAIAWGLALAAAPSAAAQTGGLTFEAKQQAIFERLFELNAGGRRTAPPATQVGTPSAGSDAPSLIDAPSFTELIALAMGNDMIAAGPGSMTASLNLFALKALMDPDVLDRQSRYARYGWLRRLGGSITLGGKGESFDRDGDGTADEALEAESLDEIVTWEARWRAIGTRDRRDTEHYQKYRTQVGAAQDAFDALFMRFLQDHQQEMTAVTDGEAFAAFLRREDVEAELKRLTLLHDRVRTALSAVNQAVDRSMVWTLAVTGTRRSDDKFGPDRTGVGVRGIVDRWGWGHTVNADWASVEGLAGKPDGDVWKLGYEASRLLKTRFEEDATVAFSAAVERYGGMPDARHDTIARAQLKIELPVKKGMTVPFSITWASHADLLTDQQLVRGNVGIAVDFSQLKPD